MESKGHFISPIEHLEKRVRELEMEIQSLRVEIGELNLIIDSYEHDYKRRLNDAQ